jgi:hypothetical protein
MTLHVETEPDAFFQRGDEGTYAGGPADSLPAGALDDEADLVPPATPEQLERRGRFKRLVAAIITTLGVGTVVTVVVRIGGNGVRVPESEVVRTSAPAPVTKSETQLPATRAEAVGTTTTTLAFAQKEARQEELTTMPHLASVPADGPAAESRAKTPARTASVPVAGPSPGSIRVSSKPPRSVASIPKSERPQAPTRSAPVPVHAVPPTAVFPD